MCAGANPIVNGTYKDSQQLLHSIRLSWENGECETSRLDFSFTIQGAWFVHRIEIDATAGIYDWIRRRVRMAPQVGESKLHIKNLDVSGGELVAEPPSRYLKRADFQPGEIEMMFVLFEGLLLREANCFTRLSDTCAEFGAV